MESTVCTTLDHKEKRNDCSTSSRPPPPQRSWQSFDEIWSPTPPHPSLTLKASLAMISAETEHSQYLSPPSSQSSQSTPASSETLSTASGDLHWSYGYFSLSSDNYCEGTLSNGRDFSMQGETTIDSMVSRTEYTGALDGKIGIAYEEQDQDESAGKRNHIDAWGNRTTSTYLVSKQQLLSILRLHHTRRHSPWTTFFTTGDFRLKWYEDE